MISYRIHHELRFDGYYFTLYSGSIDMCDDSDPYSKAYGPYTTDYGATRASVRLIIKRRAQDRPPITLRGGIPVNGRIAADIRRVQAKRSALKEG